MANRPMSFDDIPLVLKIDDLLPILDIGRSTAYELVRCGQIKSIRVGKQIRVLKRDLQHFLECGSEGCGDD